jgi:hypothetical protein
VKFIIANIYKPHVILNEYISMVIVFTVKNMNLFYLTMLNNATYFSLCDHFQAQM